MGKADPRSGATSWCELDADALRANVQYLRDRLAEGTRLGVVVKSNGYGHGMVACAREFLEAGADWLVVNALAEACTLRDAGIDAPIYVCGSVLPGQAELAARTAARVVLYDRDAAAALAEAGRIDGAELLDHVQRPPVSKQTRVRLRRARHHRGRMYALILAIFTVMIIETVVVTRRQGLMRARYALAAVFIALLLAQPAVLAGFSPAFLLLLLAVALLAAWMPTTKPNP